VIGIERGLVHVTITVGAAVYLAHMVCSRSKRRKAESAISTIEGLDPVPNPQLVKRLNRTPLRGKR